MSQILNFLFVCTAVVYVFFLPGFFISLIFFGTKKMDIIERIALAFVLSISIVPLIVFYANLLGFKITPSLIIIIIFNISNFSFLIYWLFKHKNEPQN
jgi:uncharacterized membrane protein